MTGNRPDPAARSRRGARAGQFSTRLTPPEPSPAVQASVGLKISRTPIDPVRFIEGLLINPESGERFRLTEAERTFLQHAFELTEDGRLRFPELLFSCPKKSGKTGFASMVLLYVVCALGGRFAEGYAAANDLEQAQARVFEATKRIVQATPALAADARVLQDSITFKSTGSVIKALANDYAGAAGSNPTITVFDELWAFTTEKAHRFFDEMVCPPTRQIACRLIVTYAGYTGESDLLEKLYNRGLRGEQIAPDLWAQPGMLMFWSNRFTAPWQTEAWREEMRAALRPPAYLRLICNEWVSSESAFVPMEWWDQCVDPELRPLLHAPRLPVWVGVDVSLVRDHTAVVVVTWDSAEQRVRLVAHREWRPSPDEPLDFENTVEKTLVELAQRFAVREVRYDPYQMQAVAQRLAAARIPMVEYGQTGTNMTQASTGLYELISGRNLVVYRDPEMRLAVQRSVALETPRGWKLAKQKTSHKIDLVVALAMACCGAVGASTGPAPLAGVPDLLVHDEPVSVPTWCMAVVAVVMADALGRSGICYFAHWTGDVDPKAVLLDFEADGLARIHDRSLQRCQEWAARCRARGAFVYVQPALLTGFKAKRIPVEPVPKEWLVGSGPEDMAIMAKQHAAEGRLKVAEPAYDRARDLPLGGATIFEGPVGDDPLRLAWLAGVRLAVGDG